GASIAEHLAKRLSLAQIVIRAPRHEEVARMVAFQLAAYRLAQEAGAARHDDPFAGEELAHESLLSGDCPATSSPGAQRRGYRTGGCRTRFGMRKMRRPLLVPAPRIGSDAKQSP